MSKKSKKESTLYYFTAVGCPGCKQTDPIVEKLNDEGYDILSLDLSDNLLLEKLYCQSNQISALDFSNNSLLWTLKCQQNQILNSLF